MAKQTKSAVAPAVNAPGTAPAAGTTTAAVVEKGNNDKFVPLAVMENGKPKANEKGEIVWVDPTKKVAPQAMVIINTVRAAGVEGLTRAQLNANLKGVLTTRQPESRIVTYYQKLIQEVGSVKLVKSSEVPA